MNEELHNLIANNQEAWEAAAQKNEQPSFKPLQRAGLAFWKLELARRKTGAAIDPASHELSAPLVERSLVRLSHVMDNILSDHQFQWVTEDWHSWSTLCRWRSIYAFLQEVYDQLDPDYWTDFEIEEWDEYFEEIAGSGDLPAHMIPDGIPTTHWWWWYPQDPA